MPTILPNASPLLRVERGALIVDALWVGKEVALSKGTPHEPDRPPPNGLTMSAADRTMHTRQSAVRESAASFACQRECSSEVPARGLIFPPPKLKLAERGVLERIFDEAVRIGNGTNLLEPALRAVALPLQSQTHKTHRTNSWIITRIRSLTLG